MNFDFPSDSFDAWTIFGTRLICGLTLIWFVATACCVACRRLSAALRHRLWSLSVAASILLLVPLVSLPETRLGLISIPEANRPESQQSPTANPEDSPFLSAVAPIAVEQSRAPAYGPHPASSADREMESPEIQHSRAAAGMHGDESSTPHPSAANSIPAQRSLVIVLILFLPMTYGLCRLLRAEFLAWRIRSRALVVDDGGSRELMEDICRGLRWRGTVTFRQSSATAVPLCIGWWRPVIVLPDDWHTWTAAARRAIFAHELSHIVRRDVAWQLAARTACALYWFHPFAWVAAWRMRIEREAACDDAVLRIGSSPTDYARVLLDIATRLSSGQRVPAGAVAMTARRNLEQRVRAILAADIARSPVGSVTSRFLAASMLACTLLVGMLSPLQGENGEPAQPSAPQGTANKPPESKQNAEAKPANTAQSDVAENRYPQVELRGIVVTENNEPVVDAVVTFAAGRRSTTAQTGPDGKFQISVQKSHAPHAVFVARDRDKRLLGYFQRDPKTASPVAELQIVLKAPRELSISVEDKTGKRVAGAVVAVVASNYTIAREHSDRNGHTLLRIPHDAKLMAVYAMQPGAGVDYRVFETADGRGSHPYGIPQDSSEPITLTLAGTRQIDVQVVDDQQQPVTGSPVRVWFIERPKRGTAFNCGGIDDFSVLTDASGNARLNCTPSDNVRPFGIFVHSHSQSIYKQVAIATGQEAMKLSVVLPSAVQVRGQAILNDGTPAAGAVVSFTGVGSDRANDFRDSTQCDAHGEFQIDVSGDRFYAFDATLDRWASPPQTCIFFAGRPADPVQLILQPGTRVFGAVTLGPERTPLMGKSISYTQRHDDEYDELPKDERLPAATLRKPQPAIIRFAQTDANGRYELFVGPGKYDLRESGNTPAQPLMITDQQEIEHNFHIDRLKQDERRAIQGRVVLQSAPQTGVAEATVEGWPSAPPGRGSLNAISNREGRFRARIQETELLVHAINDDRSLAGAVQIAGTEQEFVIPVRPTVNVRGRLVDSVTGEPLEDRDVEFVVQYTASRGLWTNWKFNGQTRTNRNGEFQMRGLTAGWEYEGRLILQKDDAGNVRQSRAIGIVEIKLDGPKIVDLGDISVPSK